MTDRVMLRCGTLISDPFVYFPPARPAAFQYFSKRSRSTTMIVAPPISTGIGIVV